MWDFLKLSKVENVPWGPISFMHYTSETQNCKRDPRGYKLSLVLCWSHMAGIKPWKFMLYFLYRIQSLVHVFLTVFLSSYLFLCWFYYHDKCLKFDQLYSWYVMVWNTCGKLQHWTWNKYIGNMGRKTNTNKQTKTNSTMQRPHKNWFLLTCGKWPSLKALGFLTKSNLKCSLQ